MTPKEKLLSLRASIIAVSTGGKEQRPIQLVRYGAFEVRLVPVSQPSSDRSFVFWIDLFDYEKRQSIDGGSTKDIDEAVAMMSEFELQAQALNADRST